MAKSICLFFIFILLNMGSFVFASSDEIFPMEEVIVKSKKIKSSFELSPFKTVIYQDKYKGFFKTTSEIISSGLGGQVKSTGGIGQTEVVSVRGVNSSQVAVFLDDIKLNTLSGGGFDLSLIPVSFLEKVEIFRGGFSGEYGLDALGGVIRLKTKELSGKSKFALSWSNGSMSSNNFNFSALTSAKNLNLMLQAQRLATDGSFVYLDDRATQTILDDELKKRENNFSKSQNILIKASKKEDDGREINYLMEASNMHRGIAGITTFPSDKAYEKKNLLVNQLDVKRFIKNIEINFNLGHKYSTLYFLDKEGDLTGVPIETDQKEQGFNAGLSSKIQFNEKNYFTAKYEYENIQLKDLLFGKPKRFINSFLFKGENFFLSDKLFLSSRLRLDLIKDYSENNGTRNYFQASPHFGLYYKSGKNTEFKSNFGHSYRVPNFTELYLDQGLIVGNIDLRSEKGWHYDIGVAFNNEKVKSEFSYFYESLTDAIQFVLISGFRFKPLNVEKARISGIELGTDFNLNKYLRLGFNYTYLRAIDKTGKPNQDGMQLVGRPRHKLNLNCDIKLGKGKVLVDAGILSGNFLTQANTKYLPARFDLNCSSIFEVRKNVSLSIDMKNVLNARNYDLRGFPLPGRTYFTTVYLNL